jgi:hypothetical protein
MLITRGMLPRNNGEFSLDDSVRPDLVKSNVRYEEPNHLLLPDHEGLESANNRLPVGEGREPGFGTKESERGFEILSNKPRPLGNRESMDDR